MSDTPRTDAAEQSARLNWEMSREAGDPPFAGVDLADFARELERELNVASQPIVADNGGPTFEAWWNKWGVQYATTRAASEQAFIAGQNKKALNRSRLANPSCFPELPVEFYHRGRQCLLSLERAKLLVSDLIAAIAEVEGSPQ